jgi:hypothetical protein
MSVATINASEEQSHYVGHVYQEHYARLRNYFLLQLGDTAEVETCVQETFPHFFFFMAERCWEAEAERIHDHFMKMAGLIKARKLAAHAAPRRQRPVAAPLKYISLIGALARRAGCRIKGCVSRSFATRVKQAGRPQHILRQVAPLLTMLKLLNEQIKQADEKLAEIVKDDEVVKRLTTVPGVGPVTATT